MKGNIPIELIAFTVVFFGGEADKGGAETVSVTYVLEEFGIAVE